VSEVRAEPNPEDESRAWSVRALLVAQAPRRVFAELRDDSGEAAEDRQETIAAIAFLVGVALTLVSSAAADFADDPVRRGIVIPVWLFIAGVLVGIVNYWLAGGVFFVALQLLGANASYRQARHLLTLAAVPVALSLVLLPIRLAAYGDDIFRSGGSDSGAGADVFAVLQAGFAVWAVVLLAIGIRTVYSWNWLRTSAAVAAFGGLAALADLALNLFG
jgi:Yip1 domain